MARCAGFWSDTAKDFAIKMIASANIARHLPARAVDQPNQIALKVPRPRKAGEPLEYLALSFAELDAEVDAWVAKLAAANVQPGDRVLLMVRQGLPLIAGVFALFKHGAVPIVIDPGMGLRSFLSCVDQSQPKVLLGIPIARVVSRIFRKSFRSVSIRLSASGNPLARLARTGASQRFEPIHRLPKDLAAILFTSGSTGAPKGVCYEHGMFGAQVEAIRATYSIEPGEIDLPMLPIFALFNPALGMTTVVPEIDPTRPAKVDPAKIVEAIRQENVTTSFGSPTLWNKVADYCIQNNITLPSLRRVLCAGAPVPATLWEKSGRILTSGQLESPYGATEALPVASIRAEEWLQGETASHSSEKGSCLGRALPGIRIKILGIESGVITTLAEAIELPPGEIGEIAVAGPVVTKTYDRLDTATRAAKIFDPVTGEFWHRMGDCGFLDQEGRLWFCGRKVERVLDAGVAFYTEPCEKVFRQHPQVQRCALIGIGKAANQTPAIAVQPSDPRISAADTTKLARSLRKLGRQHDATREITHFYFTTDFPVDVRHNAKIHRLALAKRLAGEKPIEML